MKNAISLMPQAAARALAPAAKSLQPARSGDLKLSLALQGGGAHGAFTWGVLDRLLEEDRLDIRAMSGTSAGALNAVALACGWCHGGRAGARVALDRLWRTVVREAARSPLNCGSLAALALGLATHLFSPYELNPLEINPLRQLLGELVDFEALRRRSPIAILIAATNIRTGQTRIFREHELTAEMVLASACLPQLHHTVEIDGEPYWDGGFSSNPPVLPLALLGRSPILLVVRINPAGGGKVPRSAAAIRNRTNEVVFGQPLAKELEQLEAIRELGRNPLNLFQPKLRRLARLDLQIIDGDETLAGLDPMTKISPTEALVGSLRLEGRAAAEEWLQARAGQA
jgi:NTE family protein